MKVRFSAAVVSGIMVLSGSSYAADSQVYLKQIRGLVLANQSEGFRTATEGMALGRGDRVMVMDGGAVALVYPNGCSGEYVGGQIITVDPSHCKGVKTKQVGQMYTAVGDAGAASDIGGSGASSGAAAGGEASGAGAGAAGADAGAVGAGTAGADAGAVGVGTAGADAGAVGAATGTGAGTAGAAAGTAGAAAGAAGAAAGVAGVGVAGLGTVATVGAVAAVGTVGVVATNSNTGGGDNSTVTVSPQ